MTKPIPEVDIHFTSVTPPFAVRKLIRKWTLAPIKYEMTMPPGDSSNCVFHSSYRPWFIVRWWQRLRYGYRWTRIDRNG